jgi:hypothetical protein
MTFSAPRAADVTVYLASRPDRATDGRFLSENIEEIDFLTDEEIRSGRWLYEDAVKPGTYYVLLRADAESSCTSYPPPDYRETHDPSCADGFSQVATLTVENRRPTVRASRWDLRGHGRRNYWVSVHVRLRICDDIGGSANLRLTRDEEKYLPYRDRRGRRRRATFGRSRDVDYLTLRGPGCRTVDLSWRLADKFFGVGYYEVRLRLRDSDGGQSRIVTKRWFTRD